MNTDIDLQIPDQVERVSTEWHSDLVPTEDKIIYRMRNAGLDGRYYFEIDGNTVKTYIGVTTKWSKLLPLDPGLIFWMKSKTPEEQEEILQDTSRYGTFGHIMFSSYFKSQQMDLNKVYGYILRHQQAEKFILDEPTQIQWEERVKNDLFALEQFRADKNIKPLAIEYIVTHEADDECPVSYAGAIDLVCEMDFNKKRVIAIVDYKTGAIRPNHAHQLTSYQYAWNKKYPDYKADMIFNWRPKDWSGKPTYELKNQTGVVSDRKFLNYMQLAGEELQTKPKSKRVYSGILEPGSPLSEHYKEIPYEEYLISIYQPTLEEI